MEDNETRGIEVNNHNDSCDYSERRRSRSTSPSRRPRINSKRIIVDNLPFKMTFREVKDIFNEHLGYCGFLDLIVAPNGRELGLGVVEFKTYEGAAKAIEKLNGTMVKNRKLYVHEERQKDIDRIANFMRQHNPGAMAGMNLGGLGVQGMMMGVGMRSNDLSIGSAGISSNLMAILQQMNVEGPVTNQIFVSNLDARVTEEKLQEVFNLAGNLQAISLMADRDGKPRKHAVLKFETPIEAVQAISMFNNQILFDCAMRIKFDRDALRGGGSGTNGSNLPSGLKGIGMGLGFMGAPARSFDDINPGIMGGNSMIDNTQFMSNSFMKGAGSEMNSFRPSRGGGMPIGGSRTILVSNLPNQYNWADLKRIFRDCGTIQFADVDMEGSQSKGTGKVRFLSAQDAQRAVQTMNGMRYVGKTIRVELEEM